MNGAQFPILDFDSQQKAQPFRVGLCFGIDDLVPALLDGYGFCEVARLVYVAAAADGDVVGQQLQGNYFNER